jgi:hypothetical protein
VELFREGSAGAGIEATLARYDDVGTARALQRWQALKNPGVSWCRGLGLGYWRAVIANNNGRFGPGARRNDRAGLGAVSLNRQIDNTRIDVDQ